MASLKDKALSGFFWSFLQNVGGRGINFIVMIVLARLLTPEIFGLIGMLMIFIQVSQMLVVAGFNQALIQKQNVDEEDFSSVFWINLVVSFVIYGILFFGAPLIADFYQQAILTKLTRVLSLVFVINAFSYVQEARLTKEMRFKTLTIIHIPSAILGGIGSVVMAFMGYGVWSIVGLQLITRFAYAVQIWFYARWKPLFIFNKAKAKRLFAYGGNLMVSQVINTIFRNIYVVVIGKFFPLASTGYYQNANNLIQYPAGTITRTFKNVIFPAFSTIQDDDKRMKIGHKKLIQQTLFLMCPMFVLAGVLAEPLFRLVFTEKWLPAVPYFQMLCVVGIFWPINVYGLNIINVKGRSDLSLKLEIVKKGFIVLSMIIVLLSGFGIWGVIIVQVLNSLVGYVLNSYYGGRFIKYSLLQQMRDILPIFLLSTVMGSTIYICNLGLNNLTDILRILLELTLGIIIYIGIAALMNFDVYRDFRDLLKEKLTFLK